MTDTPGEQLASSPLFEFVPSANARELPRKGSPIQPPTGYVVLRSGVVRKQEEANPQDVWRGN